MVRGRSFHDTTQTHKKYMGYLLGNKSKYTEKHPEGTQVSGLLGHTKKPETVPEVTL